MHIQVKCPKCQTSHKVGREHEGKGLRCRQCQTVFRIVLPAEQDTPQEQEKIVPKAADDRTRKPRDDEERSERPSIRRKPEQSTPRRASRRDDDTEDDGKKRPTKQKAGALPYVLIGCGGLAFLVIGGIIVGGFLIFQSARRAANEIASELETRSNQLVQEIEKGPARNLAVKAWPETGKSVRIVRTEKLEGARSFSREEIYMRKVLESGSPRPRKFEDTYENAVVTEPQLRTLPYQGRKIAFEQQGDAYRATASPGKPIPQADLEALTRRLGAADTSLFLLPDKPVQVGTTWTVDAARACPQLFSVAQVAAGGSTVEVKLERIDQRQEKQVAILSANLKVQLERTDDQPDAGPGSLTGTGTWELPLDGSSTATVWTFRGELQSAAGAANGTYTVREERAEQALAKLDPDPKIEVPPKTPSEPMWQGFTSTKGQFSIQFPGKPREFAAGDKSSNGKVETGDAKGALFTVTWRDYGKTTAGKSPASMLDVAATMAARGDPVTRKNIEYGTHPGLELTAKGPRTTTVERAYAVRTVLYRVTVRSSLEAAPAPTVLARYLDSFEVTGEGKSTKPGPTEEGKPGEPKLLATLGKERWPSGSSAVFSPDGKTLYAKCAEDLVIHDVVSGKSAPPVRLFGGSGKIAVESTGKLLIQSSGFKSIDFFEIANPMFSKRKIQIPVNGWALALSPDDKVIATTIQKRIDLWDFATGKSLRVLEKHSSFIWTIAYSPDGKLFAGVDAAREVLLWDAKTYVEVAKLDGDPKPAESISGEGLLAFAGDSKTLIAPGPGHCSVVVWDVAQKKALREIVCPHKINNTTVPYRFETLAVSPDGKMLALSSYNGLTYPIMFFEVDTGKPAGSFVPNSKSANRLAFSPDGKLLAVSINTGQVLLYQLK